jgi:hypothetical protein
VFFPYFYYKAVYHTRIDFFSKYRLLRGNARNLSWISHRIQVSTRCKQWCWHCICYTKKKWSMLSSQSSWSLSVRSPYLIWNITAKPGLFNIKPETFGINPKSFWFCIKQPRSFCASFVSSPSGLSPIWKIRNA